MQSILNNATEPGGQAAAPAPKPAPERPQPPRPSRHRLIWSVSLLIAAITGISLFFLLHKRTAPAETAHGVIHPAAISSSGGVRLKGSTQAIESRSILTPVLSGQQVGMLTITRLLAAGTRVKKGDLLVEFDRQAQLRDALDKQAEYDKLADQVVQEQQKESAARAKDETELHAAESDLSKAELEMQKSEILSRIDVEKAQEDLEEARATAQQLRETFELKRKAAAAAIRIVEIQRDRTRQTMLHAQANAALMQVRSPLDGVVVLNTIWKQGKMGEVEEGDQIRPGVGFMQVVDPFRMQVVVQVNQQDVLGLRTGEHAKVRLDAYPELVFDGKLEQIAPIGRSGSFSNKVRTFTAIFSIEGNNPKLMPDLSAAVDVDDNNRTESSSLQ